MEKKAIPKHPLASSARLLSGPLTLAVPNGANDLEADQVGLSERKSLSDDMSHLAQHDKPIRRAPIGRQDPAAVG